MLSFTVVSQELSVESNLEGITLKIGEEFSPNSYAVDRTGKKIDCAGVIYYNKKGVFSRADGIIVDRDLGKITANKPGNHEVVALCVSQDGQRLSRTFNVEVNYPKTKEIKITGRLPKASDKLPRMGPKINCITANLSLIHI